jgi:chromosomal replication initiator protein
VRPVASASGRRNHEQFIGVRRDQEFTGRHARRVAVRACGGSQEVVKDDSDRLSVLREELRRRLGNERYECWIGAQTELALAGSVLRVQCASPTEANWLRRNLDAVVSACVAELFGGEIAVEFCTVQKPEPLSVGAANLKQRRGKRQRVDDHPLFADAAAHAQLPESTEAGHVSAANQDDPPAAIPHKCAKHSFEDFITGSANRLAAEAGRSVALQPGRFSPLLMYGPPGTGKSHMLSAIAQHARAARTRPRVTLLTAEQFTSQFLVALEQRQLPSFRQKMRGIDVLLIDDVHFMQRAKATLEELVYTIDALQTRGGQVVLTATSSAAELQSMNAALGSRLSSGLSVAVDLPDYEMRTGIVRVLSVRMQVPLEAGVAELIAREVVGSSRLLAGAINRLIATSMAVARPMTLELARPVLADFARQHLPQVRLGDIQRAVCETFGIEPASLKSDRKTRSVAEPRMFAMWLARRYTRAALSEIGDFFGGRSHSTVVSAHRKIDALVAQQGEIVVGDHACKVEEAVQRIEAKLRSA